MESRKTIRSLYTKDFLSVRINIEDDRENFYQAGKLSHKDYEDFILDLKCRENILYISL